MGVWVTAVWSAKHGDRQARGAHMRDGGRVALYDAGEHALHAGGVGQLRVRLPCEWKVACSGCACNESTEQQSRLIYPSED